MQKMQKMEFGINLEQYFLSAFKWKNKFKEKCKILSGRDLTYLHSWVGKSNPGQKVFLHFWYHCQQCDQMMDY